MTADAAEGRAPRPLTTWVVTRVALAVTTVVTGWTLAEQPGGFLRRWDAWDVGLFVKIARWGYGGYPAHYTDRDVTAFFPGQPALLWLVHLVVRNWVAAGLLISLAAGGVACVALSRLGELEGDTLVGRRAVLYLVLSPYAVFLAAGYSEAVFLAFALPAWLAARRERWMWAGLLAAGAAVTRVTGLFLGLALVVDYLTRRGARPRAEALWLLAPFAAVGGYVVYLHGLTGDWFAWPHAQAEGWGRSLTVPWRALSTTWHSAVHAAQGPAYTWSFREEIAAMAIGVLLTVLLLARRRWGEATYVGLQVVAFGTSSFYLSVGRATLLWWPLWLLLASASVRHRWVHAAYLAVAPAWSFVLVVTFLQGHWVG